MREIKFWHQDVSPYNQKLVDASVGLFCGVALLGGDCQKSHENSWVNGGCII